MTHRFSFWVLCILGSGCMSTKAIEMDDPQLKLDKRNKILVGKMRSAPKPNIKLQKPSIATGTGTLSLESIEKTIRRRQRALNSCYTVEFKKDHSLEGKIQIQFTIETSGQTSSAHVIQNTMKSDVVAKCIASQIKRWRFPKPSGGSISIQYPFVFRSSH